MCGCFCLDNVEHLTTPTLINKDIVQNVLPFLTLKYLKKNYFGISTILSEK